MFSIKNIVGQSARGLNVTRNISTKVIKFSDNTKIIKFDNNTLMIKCNNNLKIKIK